MVLLLSACGRSPAEESATDSGTANATDSGTTVAGDTSSPSAVDASDSVTPTTSAGSVSDSQTDAGETTNQVTMSATDSTGNNTTDMTVPGETSLAESSSSDTTPPDDTTNDPDTTNNPDTTSDPDTTAGETSTTTTDGTTTSDDTTSGDETTGEPVQCGVQLKVTIRDFMFSHPDFEDFCCGQPNGMVQNMLGPNGKPVYNNPQGLLSTPENFAQWYTDVPGVNQKTMIVIDLQEIMPGVYSYSNNAFFPIDNMLWGNEGQPHNYHFTTEIHAQFQYFGGEQFTFSGDDDVWVFINKQLAIDIGGVHGPTQKSVNLDTLGLTLGLTYPLDVFHAERHTVDSNFRIDTTICSKPM